VKAITVCVNYGDLLAWTLPKFCRVFDSVTVVTTPDDAETSVVVSAYRRAHLFTTDAFYRGGDGVFRKWLALEEGLDAMGRSGWLCVIDSDIYLPEQHAIAALSVVQMTARGGLYCPPRRILAEPEKCRDNLDYMNWGTLPEGGDKELGGWMHVFTADDPILRGVKTWYPTEWCHCGGADSEHSSRWPADQRHWLPFSVLHLGPVGQNWFGRTTPTLHGITPANADQSRQRMARMLARRRATRGRNKFAGEKIAGEKIIPAE
jgi:hypothetical protein